MQSLVLFSYRQPVEGYKFRWGVLESRRDTEKYPVHNDAYRADDPAFERSRDLDTVTTSRGVRAFYRQRQNWKIKIPFVGSLVKPFLKS
jgi:hypothetical protein